MESVPRSPRSCQGIGSKVSLVNKKSPNCQKFVRCGNTVPIPVFPQGTAFEVPPAWPPPPTSPSCRCPGWGSSGPSSTRRWRRRRRRRGRCCRRPRRWWGCGGTRVLRSRTTDIVPRTPLPGARSALREPTSFSSRCGHKCRNIGVVKCAGHILCTVLVLVYSSPQVCRRIMRHFRSWVEYHWLVTSTSLASHETNAVKVALQV